MPKLLVGVDWLHHVLQPASWEGKFAHFGTARVVGPGPIPFGQELSYLVFRVVLDFIHAVADGRRLAC